MMAAAVGEELTSQNEVLDDMIESVDRADSRIRDATQRIKRLMWGVWCKDKKCDLDFDLAIFTVYSQQGQINKIPGHNYGNNIRVGG